MIEAIKQANKLYFTSLKVQLALMVFGIKVKMALTVEDHVTMSVQLALMELGIKMKLTLTAEEYVLLVLTKYCCFSRNNDIR